LECRAHLGADYAGNWGPAESSFQNVLNIMGKNKHKHRHNTFAPVTTSSAAQVVSPISPTSSPVPSTSAEAAPRIMAIAADANSQLTEDDLNNPPTPPPPPSNSEIDLPKLWKVAHEAKELFERARTRAEAAELRAKEREDNAQASISKLDERET